MVMFIHFPHSHDRPVGDTPVAPPVHGATPQAEDGLGDLYLSDTRGIEVEEVGAVEFLREWGRAIARVAMALSTRNSGTRNSGNGDKDF